MGQSGILLKIWQNEQEELWTEQSVPPAQASLHMLFLPKTLLPSLSPPSPPAQALSPAELLLKLHLPAQKPLPRRSLPWFPEGGHNYVIPILVCMGHNKAPQVWWPQTIEIQSLTLLEGRSLRSRCQPGPDLSESLGKYSCLPLPAFSGSKCRSASPCITPPSVPTLTCPPPLLSCSL